MQKPALTKLLAMALLLPVVACSGRDLSPQEDDAPQAGARREFEPESTVFGDDGLSLSSIRDGSLFGLGPQSGETLPVNKFIWQASLDTLSFLPLSSTDPFTGVIATDWGSTPDAPGERFKVTAYVLNPNLAASSLRVAVFRETRNEDGLWVPAPVSPETALKLEDAILVRARQIRVASSGEETTS